MEQKDSYKQIVKSTSIVGGSQILNILIGVVRMKVLAILLGPAGVGIAGIFQTIIDLVRDATGFGVNFSGVKSIAEVSESGDSQKISRTILVLRRWALGTGLLGTILIIIFCNYFSKYSFGNFDYATRISYLSIIILTSAISASQVALLQGLRKILQMAQATLIGTVFGTLISLPLYWFYGNDGIVPGMILTSMGSVTVSWLYIRKIPVQSVKLSLGDTIKEGLGMAKLGFFIVVNGFVATLSMYVIRAIIVEHLDLVSVGYFQAVWTISTLYINILLHAMLADYFPRLTLLQSDNKASNQLINQQLEVTLLVGCPMLVGMIIFSPLALNILYSSAFNIAVPVMRWQMAGSFFTLVSWPLGVLYLSKNEGLYCVISESLRQIIYISIIYFGWDYLGFTGLGIGFFIAGLLNAIFVYFSLDRISSFRFTSINLKFILVFGLIIISVLVLSIAAAPIYSYSINIIILLLVSVYCFKKLDNLIGLKELFLTKVLKKNRSND